MWNFRIVFIFVLIGRFLQAEELIKPQCDFSEVGFYIVNGEKDAVFVRLNETEKIISILKDKSQHAHKHYHEKIEKISTLYCYGYTETWGNNHTKAIKKAYQKRGDSTIFFIEWSKYNNGNFLHEAVHNARIVAKLVGDTLWNLHTKNIIDLKNFDFIGHSLGAHLVAFVARHIKNASKDQLLIRKIIASDPAGPTFFESMVIERNQQPLNKNDAQFVHVIHSDTFFYGASKSIGHVDIYPNSGKFQAGCPPPDFINLENDSNFCSHRRGWALLAESIETTERKAFPAILCGSWDNFKNSTCEKSGLNYLGYNAINNVPGNYYLQTNPNSPYDRQQEGLKFSV